MIQNNVFLVGFDFEFGYVPSETPCTSLYSFP